ncbi:hypothetical protein BJ508DRAFT_375060 [Ascobolus immersus RN42]|uniref:Uncharacterized protein n=1 Tax=Ascobolus immersus RN42 TaxID=1160509 RepID=A0A3N4IHA2_ASCIM|nr:hypothetical protein BJ508DRAFT_375060 [Ascobolus immersus RN42]
MASTHTPNPETPPQSSRKLPPHLRLLPSLITLLASPSPHTESLQELSHLILDTPTGLFHLSRSPLQTIILGSILIYSDIFQRLQAGNAGSPGLDVEKLQSQFQEVYDELLEMFWEFSVLVGGLEDSIREDGLLKGPMFEGGMAVVSLVWWMTTVMFEGMYGERVEGGFVEVLRIILDQFEVGDNEAIGALLGIVEPEVNECGEGESESQMESATLAKKPDDRTQSGKESRTRKEEAWVAGFEAMKEMNERFRKMFRSCGRRFL